MKSFFVSFYLILILCHQVVLAEPDIEGNFAFMRKALATAQQDASKDNLMKLGVAATRMSGYKWKFTEEYANERSLLLQQAIEIPGHAKVFADELERRRGMYGGNTYPNVAYADSKRADYLFYIAVYPSPEALKVLGELLYDFRDKVPDNVGMGGGRVEENAYIAACAISMMELREPPLAPLMAPGALKYNSEAYGTDLGSVQAWYEKVKAGQIPFSFKGHTVEYRFKPDGSWDTIPIANPPDDAPKVEVQEEPEMKPEKRVSVQPRVAHKETPAVNWYLLGGLVVILSAVAALAIRIKRKR